MSRNEYNIAIAGGGIAGLALAVGLYTNHKHLTFHVFEGAHEYRDVGQGLAIHLNGIKAMEDITTALAQAYFDKGMIMGEPDQELSTEIIIAGGPDQGMDLAKLGRAKNRKTISRSELLEGFSSLLPADKISFNKRLTAVHQDEHHAGVQLTFTDGSTTTADCLIAADGIHSPTRRYILGAAHPAAEPINPDRWHMYRTLVPMDTARAHGVPDRWTRGVPIMVGPHGYINSMPQHRGTQISGSVCVQDAPRDADGNIQPLDPALFAEYTADARAIVDMVAAHPVPGWTLMDHDPAPTYVRGRVAMIGDAAHATFPFNGQGAAQAIEDACVLNHLFSRLDSMDQIEAIFVAYDAVRRPRSQRVAEYSRQFGRIFGFREGNLHEDPEAMQKVLGAGGQYSNAVDIGKQNHQAMALFEQTTMATVNGAPKT